MTPDILLVNSFGPAFTSSSIRTRPPGGSELEIALLATTLAKRGHNVAVANAVDCVTIEEDGVHYVPLEAVRAYWPKKCLYISRFSRVLLFNDLPPRVVVRCTDTFCADYDHHRSILESGKAALVGVTKWHTDQWTYAAEKTHVAPFLFPAEVKKVPYRFVFASGPCKGLQPTLKFWAVFKAKYHELAPAELFLVSPGWGDEWPRPGSRDPELNVTFVGAPPPQAYRNLVASAEGLFFVNAWTETFCGVAALAERDHVRTHILCTSGFGGIPEAIRNHTLLTNDPIAFEERFLEAWRDRENPKWYCDDVEDRSPEALAPQWERVLHLA